MLSAAESIRLFLESQKNSRNTDLLTRVLEYGMDLELQVSVSPRGGELATGQTSTFTDGLNTWFSFRIPKNSMSNPSWSDFPLQFPLDRYVEAIGSTGWNWRKRQSLWVAFDYDAIAGHAPGTGVSDSELKRVQDAVRNLDYVETRRSTGGLGLHLYVMLPSEVETANHTEHAAVAREVLARMTEDTGVDLDAPVDVCGSNMWIYSSHASEANQGFALLSPAKATYPYDLSNWRVHLPVVNRTRHKVTVGEPSEQSIFDALASAHPKTPLDAKHIEIRDALAALGTAIWVQDHGLLQTHTRLLKQVHDQHDIVGPFETISPGTNTNQPNCFCFPIAGGAWRVCRFGKGTAEAATWSRSESTHTTCFFNRLPDLKTAAATTDGKLLARGGFEYGMLRDAAATVKLVDPGVTVNVPEKLATRRAVLRQSQDKLIIEVPKMSDDPEMDGWNSTDKKNTWTQVIAVTLPEMDTVTTHPEVRFLVTVDGIEIGWQLLTKGGWQPRTEGRIKTWLQSCGHARANAECILGATHAAPWTLVAEPFTPEYPGGRRWNRGAPQLAYMPAPHDGDAHPTWTKILQHLGQALTQSIRDSHPSLVDVGVTTGGEFLQAWYAVVFRNPLLHLPYLFFTGPQNIGKSLAFEAPELLLVNKVGCVDAYRAVTAEFNGQLEGAVLGYIDDQRLSPKVNDLLKKLVTSDDITIRKMRTDPYTVPNTTHWIHCANQDDALQVPPGDTRNIVIRVSEFDGPEIPKEQLKTLLRAEAPFFVHSLLSMRLPQPSGRLALPVIDTDERQLSIETNDTMLDTFVRVHCKQEAGATIERSEFVTRILAEYKDIGYTRSDLNRDFAASHKFRITRPRIGGLQVRAIEGYAWK